LSFYPLRLGTYRLDANLPTDPVEVSTVVSLGGGYTMALLGAALGSLLLVYAATERNQKVSGRRIVFGVLTGLVLACLAFNRCVLPGGFPVPTFSDSPSWNALWLGLAGGWFGPGTLLLLLPRLLERMGNPSTKAESPQSDLSASPFTETTPTMDSSTSPSPIPRPR
jgi:hypothetical protein